MTAAALTLGGWLAALVAAALAAGVLRLLLSQREAAVRAAHELRGPLTAIGLAFELEARRSQAVDRWRAVELELARANVALEDLTGRSPRVGLARLERVDARGLLERCVGAAALRAAAAGVALSGRWEGPPAFVWGDPVRLAQALANLIANAIEHGGGEVEVFGRAVGRQVRVEVRDRGPGLPATVGELVGRARAGVGERGRGLAIASAIAEQHHGRLAAAPSDRGARVVLELPASVESPS